MFTIDDLKKILKQRPFIPARIVTSTGQTYDIYHPDLVILGRGFLMVGVPGSDDPIVADQINRIAMIHITEIRDLPIPTAPSANGHAEV